MVYSVLINFTEVNLKPYRTINVILEKAFNYNYKLRIEKLTFYADDRLGLVWSRDRLVLAKVMEKKLENSVSW